MDHALLEDLKELLDLLLLVRVTFGQVCDWLCLFVYSFMLFWVHSCLVLFISFVNIGAVCGGGYSQYVQLHSGTTKTQTHKHKDQIHKHKHTHAQYHTLKHSEQSELFQSNGRKLVFDIRFYFCKRKIKTQTAQP